MAKKRATGRKRRKPRSPRWTVMVFMGANTEAGNAPMIKAAQADIREMRAVGSGGTLNIFVQVHGTGVPRRYHIGKGNPAGNPVPVDERNVDNGHALVSFIRSSIIKAKHQPQDRSMLVLWGHAYDFAFAHTPTGSGTVDALDFIELGQVLKDFQEEMRRYTGAKEPPKVDIVAFDACDVATVEMACQLAPYAKYLLGSQMGVPIPGWPYDRILGRLRYPEGERLMGPAELGSYAVRRYCESYAPLQRAVSLTLLDLQQTPELIARTKVLALLLDIAITQRPSMRDLIARLFRQAQTVDNKPYVDVADLCLNLVRESGDPLLIAASRAVGDFLLAPSPVAVGESVKGEGRPFVVEHGRNAGATAKLNGVSMYAPHVAYTYDSAVERVYCKFEFALKTRWSGLVHGLASSRFGSS